MSAEDAAPAHGSGLRAVVLGTGAADGIPQPFCACRTCVDARTRGRHRLPGGVLIDGMILIDAPAETTAAVARAGVDLRGLRIIAVTHAHHDHWHPSLLLHRDWIAGLDEAVRTQPLVVLGPPSVLTSARDWLPPDTDVTLRPAVIGQTHEVGEHRITVLPSTHGQVAAGAASDPWATEAVLYEVRTASAALLYAADTGPPDAGLLAAVTAAAYDTVLLELTFGAGSLDPNQPCNPSTPGHLDHGTFPMTLQRFRDVGAITDDTDVVAIHVGHHNPPADELETILSRWGARTVEDGAQLRVGQPDPGRIAPSRAPLVLATGGARSGKSVYLEERAVNSGRPVVYIATGYPATTGDEEWAGRIRTHRRRRPAHWHTVESADVVEELLAVSTGQCVIVDCLSLWLTRLIDRVEGWAEPAKATAVFDAELPRLVAALRAAADRDVAVLMVTNEVGSGVVPASEAGRLFRDLLGRLNTGVAAICDETVLLVAGRPLVLPRAEADPHTPEEKL